MKVFENDSVAHHEGKPLREIPGKAVRIEIDDRSAFIVKALDSGEIEVYAVGFSAQVVIRPISSNKVLLAMVDVWKPLQGEGKA